MQNPQITEETVATFDTQTGILLGEEARTTEITRKPLNRYETLLRNWTLAVFRHYLRYAPFSVGRTYCWERCSQQSKAFVAKTRYKSMIKGSTDDLIQRYIYFFGVWEPNLTEFIAHRLSRGDVFVDVGANIGYFSLQAAKLVGNTGRVIAFEASPTIYELLQDNIILNQYANIVPYNIAAGDTIGTTPVFFTGDHNIGMTNTVPGLAGEFETEVALLPLATVISDSVWQKARIVKIDVEGAEFSVVQGLRKLLEKKSNPEVEIVVEINPDPLRLQGLDPADILAFFREFGFFPYYLKCNGTADDYLSGRQQRHAARITSAITQQTDVIFSQQKRDVLVI